MSRDFASGESKSGTTRRALLRTLGVAPVAATRDVAQLGASGVRRSSCGAGWRVGRAASVAGTPSIDGDTSATQWSHRQLRMPVMSAHGSAGEDGDHDANGMSETEMLELMEAAILALPRLTREAFLAHRLDDLSYGEIATITGVSTRRIEREIARALIALDRALSERQPPRPRWWQCIFRFVAGMRRRGARTL